MSSKNLALVLEHIENCSQKTSEFVNLYSGNLFYIPLYCNNRACQNSLCNEHRGYLHSRNHQAQIDYAKKYIKSPKSFIFTGWRLYGSIDEIRSKARAELIRLFSLLTRFSRTTFIIYMEFKLNTDGSKYLHFHVISGSIGDYHTVQALWGRYVKYEYPVKKESLIDYIKKYTGKSPLLPTPESQLDYLGLTYKLQMCRYDIPRKKAILELEYQNPLPSCEPLDLLYLEAYNTAKNDVWPWEISKDKPPTVEPRKKPRINHVTNYTPRELADKKSFNKIYRANSDAFINRLKQACAEQSKKWGEPHN